MDAAVLLEQLKKRDITVLPYHGRLRAVGRTDRLTAELKAQLVAHKLALMVQVGAAQSPPLSLEAQFAEAIQRCYTEADLERVTGELQAAARTGLLGDAQEAGLLQQAVTRRRRLPRSLEELSLTELEDPDMILPLASHVLGESVLVAGVRARIPADNTLTVYRAAELRQVADAPPDIRQAVHACKRVFDGEILPG